MPFLDRLLRGKLSDLVTCIVQAEGDGWKATWASDGRTPPAFGAAALSSATEQASAAVAALYDGRPERESAELQFAIYPWTGSKAMTILDIHRDALGFRAADIQGSGISVTGASLEALVTDAERDSNVPVTGMFRWVRQVRDLGAPS